MAVTRYWQRREMWARRLRNRRTRRALRRGVRMLWGAKAKLFLHMNGRTIEIQSWKAIEFKA